MSWKDIGDQPVYVLVAHDGTEVLLSWREGAIDVWGASEESVWLDIPLIADALRVRLVGDDGEQYQVESATAATDRSQPARPLAEEASGRG